MLLEARNGPKGLAGERGELRGGDESQLARSLPGIQQQPDIGGGNARGLVQALFSHVVGNQEVVPLGAELVEVTPDAQSVRDKVLAVVGRDAMLFARRAVQPLCDGRGRAHRASTGNAQKKAHPAAAKNQTSAPAVMTTAGVAAK